MVERSPEIPGKIQRIKRSLVQVGFASLVTLGSSACLPFEIPPYQKADEFLDCGSEGKGIPSTHLVSVQRWERPPILWVITSPTDWRVKDLGPDEECLRRLERARQPGRWTTLTPREK